MHPWAWWKKTWNTPTSLARCWILNVFWGFIIVWNVWVTRDFRGIWGVLLGVILAILILAMYLNTRQTYFRRRAVMMQEHILDLEHGSLQVHIGLVDPKRLPKDDPRRDIIRGMRESGSNSCRAQGHIDPDGRLVFDEWDFETPSDQPY